MKAMIFAAGLGTRLRPLTDTMPKAMVPVCGRPLLGHVLDRLDGAGVESFVINTHHFPEQIHSYIEGRQDLAGRVAFSDEQIAPLETGGGVLAAEKLLRGDGAFLVHNVDILSNLDIRAFVDGRQQDALATLLVSERQTQRYLLFDEQMSLVGWTNVATGQVRTPYDGLDVEKCRKLAFAGIHCMSEGVFDAMRTLGFEGAFSIIDFYLAACRQYRICGQVSPGLRLLDVGKQQTLQEAENFIKTI